jgi:adenylosuccinate lyase
VLNVTSGMVVNEKIIEKTVNEYLPFIATENLLMEAVKRGGDRQQLHEVIRQASMEATAKMKNGEGCDLISALSKHPEFGMTEEEMNAVLDAKLYTGRCGEQVERYVKKLAPVTAQFEEVDKEISI